jgi:hypothetical protein
MRLGVESGKASPISADKLALHAAMRPQMIDAVLRRHADDAVALALARVRVGAELSNAGLSLGFRRIIVRGAIDIISGVGRSAQAFFHHRAARMGAVP